jgi:hypothetical protein
MVDIYFEEERRAPLQVKQQKYSRITQRFVKYSFGLIKTPAQATTAQLVVALALFTLAGYLFSRSGDVAVSTKTAQELIDATLPTGVKN